MENLDEIKIIKKFGIVTNNQIIIDRGNETQTKIVIESISKLKLVKKRVLYLNLLLLGIGILTIATVLLNLHVKLAYLVSLSVVSLTTIIYAFKHKFYLYSLVIKLKNNEQHVIKTSQLERKNIKDFYYAIFDKTKKLDKINYLASNFQEV